MDVIQNTKNASIRADKKSKTGSVVQQHGQEQRARHGSPFALALTWWPATHGDNTVRFVSVRGEWSRGRGRERQPKEQTVLFANKFSGVDGGARLDDSAVPNFCPTALRIGLLSS